MRRLALAALAALAPQVALAAPTEAQKKAAREHFQKGTTHYNLGRFDEAIQEFEKGYEQVPDPVFIFNIAQSHRLKGDAARALFFYKRYLALSPDAANRAEVEAFIGELEAQLKAGQGAGQTGAGSSAGKSGSPAGGAGGAGRAGGAGGTAGGAGKTGGAGGPGGAAGKTGGAGGGVGTVGSGAGRTGAGGAGGTAGGAGASGVARADGATGALGAEGAADVGGIGAGGSVTGAAGDVPSDSRRDDGEPGDAGADGMVEATEETGARLPLRFAVEAGPAFVSMGDLPNEIPTQMSLRLGAAYTLGLGPVQLDAGVAGTATPIPYETVMGESGTTTLWGVLLNVGARVPLFGVLAARAELGLGVQWWAGLGEGNPFTGVGQAADGPVPMFAWRVAAGLDYALGHGFFVQLTPALVSSPAPENSDSRIGTIRHVDVLLGIGYSL